MATTLWMATVTTILVGSSNVAPEARVSHQMLLSAETCDQWKADFDSKPPAGPVDAVTGKSILGQYFTCVPIDVERMKKEMADAMEHMN